MAALTLCFVISKAQNIYYPTGSSQLLQSTAVDVAGLLSRALPGSNFSAQVYTIKPSTGWIFVYDTLMTDNQACHVQGNGSNLLQFSAASDNGLCFGVYQYLQKLGFRFYQPGSIWEQIPNLANVFTAIDPELSMQSDVITRDMLPSAVTYIITNCGQADAMKQVRNLLQEAQIPESEWEDWLSQVRDMTE